ncbi:DedA family protein [Agitococcus lubricus]|uniref:Membrane-associated protein n=1 Tax=Agitococcus lubricus TaxID=1077255 RepID=A0A2T5IZG9_9GAMM|nr:DedA family protein [Agitococcus lubricus]PTQ89415.1 membrane-associated protein [Agitococcus lubricus]
MFLIDFILHVDQHLAEFVANYGLWIYAILFLIVFVETGLVVMPFLPGDSLLFAAGALAAIGQMNPFILGLVIFVAAFLGDTCNYHIGKHLGRKMIEKYRLINMKYLHDTEAYFAKHGGKTVVFARFVPIVRTFSPFVSGMGAMPFKRFILFSMFGSACWILSFVTLGYFFGTLPVVKENFTLVIFGIIGISFAPIIFHAIKAKFSPANAS